MPRDQDPHLSLRLVSLDISGVDGIADAQRLENLIQALAGVDGVRIDPRTGRGTLRVDGEYSPKRVQSLIELEGFDAIVIDAEEAEQGPARSSRSSLGSASVLVALFLLLATGGAAGLAWARHRKELPFELPDAAWHFAPGALGLLSALWLLLHLARRAWRSLRQGVPGDEGLSLLGLALAAGATAYLAWTSYPEGASSPIPVDPEGRGLGSALPLHHLIALACAVWSAALLTRVALASRGLRRLHSVPAERLGLAPEVASLLRVDGSVRPVPSRLVLPFEQVKVRPGERVPVDGEVIEGHSIVDARDWGGASELESVDIGGVVNAGTQNGAGTLVLATYASGRQTALARMSERLRKASSAAAGLEHEDSRTTAAGRRNRRYCWLILLLSLGGLTALWLLPSSPVHWAAAAAACSAILVGSGPRAAVWGWGRSMACGLQAGAAQHLWIRDVEVIPKLAQVDVLVADPAGALTTAPPTVLGPWPVETGEEVEPKEVLSRLAALGAGRAAPLAQSLVRAATETGLELPQAPRKRSAGGMGGLVSGREIWVGGWNAALQRGHQSAEVQRLVARARDAGAVPYLVEEDGRLVAGLGLLDGIEGEGAVALEALAKLDVKTLTMSGLETMTTERLSSQLGAVHGEGELTPHAKAARVKTLRESGHRPLVLGETAEDGPSLAQAWVDTHLGGGADAHLVGSVTIPGGDPRLLAPLVKHARGATRRGRWATRLGLFWHLLLLAASAVAILVYAPTPGLAWTWAIAAGLMGQLILLAIQTTTLALNDGPTGRPS